MSKKFWDKHEARIFFMSVTFLVGSFISLLGGLLWWKIPDAKTLGVSLVGMGVGYIAGVATIANNKARSPDKDIVDSEPPKLPEIKV